MKKIIVIIAILFSLIGFLSAQSVGINNTTPDASSILDIKSNNKGLLIPRMNAAGITSISNPAKGLLVLDTATNQLMVNMGTTASPDWQTIVFKSGWSLTGNSNIDPANNFIGTTDAKPLLFRVNNLPAGQVHPTNKNAAFGLSALSSNTTGALNTAIGFQSLYSNTIGNFNTATGYLALQNNTTGSSNTAIGGNSLFSNTTGVWNTAGGANALSYNNTGNYNTAYGGISLGNNTSGTENVATGYAALESNTTGSYNIAIGKDALYSNSIGSENTVAGQGSMFTNTTGFQNCAFGRNTLHENNNGVYNTAIGYSALFSNTGNYNTATGFEALYNNSTGISNTANGLSALFSNTIGSHNTATGSDALYYNTSGDNNTAFGSDALLLNTSGDNNTSVGYQSLISNTTGSRNTANGFVALYNNTAGSDNTAIGYQALFYNTSGNVNIAYGNGALYSNVSGNYNIAIGFNAGSCGGFTNLDNSVVIGSETCAQNSNYSILSTPTTVWNGGHQAWSTYSDSRIKRNIKENVAGLSFIMKLRPVTYNKSISDETKITGSEMKDYPSKYDVEKIRYTGFIAQDVEKAAQEIGFDFSGLTKPKTSTDLYSLSYESFVVPLVKAVQEQEVIIEKQQLRNDKLEKEIADLKEQNKNILAALDKLNQNKQK